MHQNCSSSIISYVDYTTFFFTNPWLVRSSSDILNCFQILANFCLYFSDWVSSNSLHDTSRAYKDFLFTWRKLFYKKKKVISCSPILHRSIKDDDLQRHDHINTTFGQERVIIPFFQSDKSFFICFSQTIEYRNQLFFLQLAYWIFRFSNPKGGNHEGSWEPGFQVMVTTSAISWQITEDFVHKKHTVLEGKKLLNWEVFQVPSFFTLSIKEVK